MAVPTRDAIEAVNAAHERYVWDYLNAHLPARCIPEIELDEAAELLDELTRLIHRHVVTSTDWRRALASHGITAAEWALAVQASRAHGHLADACLRSVHLHAVGRAS